MLDSNMLSLLGKSKNRLENVIFNFRSSIDSNNFKFSKYFYLTCITLFVKVSHQYFAALFFQKIYLFFESTKNLQFTDWCENLIYVSSLFQTCNYSSFSLKKFETKFESNPPIIERAVNQDESGFLLQIPISSQNNCLLEGPKGRCSCQNLSHTINQ